MNEFLILRLASHSDQAMQWLVWSQREQEVIASGELAGSAQLTELQSWSTGRQIIALAPLKDCGLAQVAMPKKNRRQAMSALPYMLEDQLAEDVDNIHLTVTGQSSDDVSVCYINHSKMQLWLSWLQDAELQVAKIVPDVLTLPCSDEQWHAVQLGEQWLVRQNESQGALLENQNWLSAWWRHSELPENGLVSYTPWPESLDSEQVTIDLAELPLLALVTGAISSKINLRHGPYRSRAKRSNQALRPWLSVAVLTVVAITIHLVTLGLRISELNNQAEQLKNEIVSTYKIAFPKQKNVKNPRAQMRQKLREISGSEGPEQSFLHVLHDMSDAYRTVAGLQIQGLRFDIKRGEIRVQAAAENFQQFEQFKAAISGPYEAEVGALNNKGGRVNGTVTIRRVS